MDTSWRKYNRTKSHIAQGKWNLIQFRNMYTHCSVPFLAMLQVLVFPGLGRLHEDSYVFELQHLIVCEAYSPIQMK